MPSLHSASGDMEFALVEAVIRHPQPEHGARSLVLALGVLVGDQQHQDQGISQQSALKSRDSPLKASIRKPSAPR